MSRQDGFTLLELCLVVVVGLMLFSLAVPSIEGLFAERKLKASFEEFDDFVRQVKTRAEREHRAFVMIWDESGINVEPDEPTLDDQPTDADHFAFNNGTFKLDRPAALQKEPAAEWLFWRNGTCEPAVVYFEGDAGSWSVRYDPLTASATFLDSATATPAPAK